MPRPREEGVASSEELWRRGLIRWERRCGDEEVCNSVRCWGGFLAQLGAV